MKFFLFLIIVFGTHSALAAQHATVVTEGAIVYRKPNFDSAVIGYFQRGRKVVISNKTHSAFYRVKFKQGLYGYVSDVDVTSASKSKSGQSKDSEKEKKGNPARVSPPWRATAFGLFAGLIQFTELINQTDYSSRLTAFGFQFSTPFSLLDGPFSLETTLLYHSGAPTYYQEVSSTAPSGTILFLDSVVTFPLSTFSGVAGAFMIGAGPLISQSSFDVTIGGASKSLRETKLGISVVGGAVYRFQSVIAKVEIKYIVEKASYYGVVGGLQYAFK